MRRKRAVQQTSYYPMLLPEFELYGIKPSGGELTVRDVARSFMIFDHMI